jgi:RNA polymerase sigma factor (sigma-70 family)
LIDLARRHARHEHPHGYGAGDGSGTGDAPIDHTLTDAGELELWTRFHEAVEHLSAEEREVFSLGFYHAWTQPQMADLLGVNERTVRRRWQAACQELNRLVGGELPGL